VDTGFGPGGEITRYYDSLIAKVIAHAPTRDDAIDKLKNALLDFHILGVKTNIAYLLEILQHPEFRAGNIDTAFLERELPEWQPHTTIPQELADILAASSDLKATGSAALVAGVWDSADSFRNVR
jgi:acetyl/propionyl-CoA carboxylase alpha subunit